MTVRKRPAHPAAELMPAMTNEEYEELADSIEAEGLKLPIVLDREGRVLDGLHRQRACIDRGVTPRYETRDLEGQDALEFVWACNAARRHLEPGQRAALRLRFDGELERLRKSRKPANIRTDSRVENKSAASSVRGNAATDQLNAKSTSSLSGRTREVIAQAAGCSPRTAAKAMTVAEHDRELHAKVCDGQLSLESAYKQIRRAAEQAGKASQLDIAEAEAAEHRTTPAWVVWSLLGSEHTRTGFSDYARALDPFAGEGQIPSAVAAVLPSMRWALYELRPSCAEVLNARYPEASVTIGDFFEVFENRAISLPTISQHVGAGTGCDLAIFNPPFSLALDAVKFLFERAPSVAIWMLQRRNWIDQARSAWLRDHMPDEFVLPKRITFGQAATGNTYTGTDNCSHCWYHWPTDGRHR
ncbi:MAG: ParB N-terminal domain-containing protein, partial [Proteobacteria bacterium]|nr:ParB N-terminal domain-containing protein [Pseudomonadota bacterium]